MEINLSVKDKDNRLTHNQWSGGQYLNSTLGFNKGTTATVFTIENDSLKVSNNGQSQYTSCKIQYNVTLEDHLKTMTLTSKIISHDYDIYLQLYIDNTWKQLAQLPKSDTFQILELSGIIPENSEVLEFRWSPVGNELDAVFYLKYISLTIQ
ncbi:hypothetical protein [uncultured Methanobrevibacter sp.]|uniref:hypothetical protein n=1 Tax=uncultured Methanobrevibacter sp. TaxID=253161 RepID=UPI0025D41693|nr:hypothetical protein [uncultured Methanobrevibacter sp.]